jgi:hypothetical protein
MTEELGHRLKEEPVGTTVRGRIKVVIQSEKIEGFWKVVTRQWNRLAAAKSPGCEDLLLTEREWLVLWRGILAARCSYIDLEGSYPTYRSLRPRRAEVPLLMWEALYCYGHVATEYGADYIISASADWPSAEEFSQAYGKWLNALPIYLLVIECSRSLPEAERACPAFILNVTERNGSLVVQSSYPLRDVRPRDTLWSVIALPPTPDLAVPKTVYLEWQPDLVIGELLRALVKKEGSDRV